jgi:hypothetical protein
MRPNKLHRLVFLPVRASNRNGGSAAMMVPHPGRTGRFPWPALAFSAGAIVAMLIFYVALVTALAVGRDLAGQLVSARLW